jgi:SAM-dependent methyltransferase
MPGEKAIDFDQVAEFYDLYAAATYDVAFWARMLGTAPAPRLELMCGTGRLCLALHAAGIAMDGLDYSAGMLAVFREKARASGYPGQVLQGDARSADLGRRYGTIVLAFQSIAEVVDDGDKRRLFANVAAHLLPGGRFWLTAHNPATRRQLFDGATRDLGRHTLAATGESVAVSGRWRLYPATDIVEGEQRYECTRGGAQTRTIVLPMRFHLAAPTWLEKTARSVGFTPDRVYGDYDGGAFDPGTSAFWIAELVAPDS